MEISLDIIYDISLDDSNPVGNIKSIIILAQLNITLLKSLRSNKSINLVTLNAVQFFDGVLDLTFVSLNINNENKSIRFLDKLHRRFSCKRVFDDRELVQCGLAGCAFGSILGGTGQINCLSSVEVNLLVNTGSFLRKSLCQLLCYLCCLSCEHPNKR